MALAVTFAATLVVGEATAQTRVANSVGAAKQTVLKTSIDRATAEKHALWPALQLAVETYQHMRKNIEDYSCVVIRQERVAGTLREHQYMQARIRHHRTRDGMDVVPFSVHLKFLAPSSVEGREVLYVTGQNDGDMFVRKGGKRFAFVTLQMKPDSEIAMQENRYPVTEFGFENLVRRLIEVAKEDIALNVDADVQFFNDAKVDGRSCTGIKVTHTTYDSRQRFHSATVFLDNEYRVPIHFEAYDWPHEVGTSPVLLEKYTYRDIKLNVGYGNADFDRANPDYRLR
jgi:hypothetical protein